MRKRFTSSERCVEREPEGEQGFMLLGLIVAIFFILLTLSVAAPKVAQALRREREVEAVHRGNQYVRAIRLYYKKFGHYPGSIEQLEKTNNIRFLRQRYVDPMTGKDDWRLIKVGEAKTTVKGFFGQPLAGLTAGLGSAASMASSGPAGAGAAPGQSTSAFGSPAAGASAFGGASPGGGGIGASSGATGLPTLGGSSPSGATNGPVSNGPATLGASSDSSASPGAGANSTLGSAAGIASQSQGSSIGGGAPFVGVGVPKEGDSITILNEQTSYNTWEFIYDPRIEQLYAKAGLFGGASSGTPGLGSAAPNSSGFGAQPSSGYGAQPSSGFGASPGSGFGTAPGSSTPTAPTAPPPQPPQQ
jgi:type II secretory pathway pseudopilin PulG